MLLAIVLVLGIAPSITACRYSDVLTERIQQQDAEVDPNAEPQYKNVADATPQDFQSYQEQQTDNVDEQEETLPEFSELPTTVQETIITQYIQDSDNNTEAATGGNDASDAKARTNSSDGTNTSNNQSGSDTSSQKGNGTSKNSGADQKPSRSDNTGTGSSAGDEASSGGLPSDNNQNTGSDPTGGNGGSGRIVAGGSYDSLPANTHTIAACGEYALIVQMLAGNGALVAADRQWLDTIRETSAFPGEGLENVEAAWSGDGTEAGEVDVDALIRIHPDVVLAGSNTATLSQSDADTLAANGINVVVMPTLDNQFALDSDITTAVRVVGELLKNASSQYSAYAMAQQYVQFHDSVLKNVTSANGGYTTWMQGGSNHAFLYQGASTDTGLATSSLSNTRYVVSYVDGWASSRASSYYDSRSWNSFHVYPGIAGIAYSSGSLAQVDTSDGLAVYPTAGSSTVSNSVYLTLDYYLQSGGAMDMGSLGTQWHTWGLISQAFLANLPSGHQALSSAQLFMQFGSNYRADWMSLGEGKYPAIIARDSYTAAMIKTSGEKENGYYNLGLPYQVWVVPDGIAGSWADGTVESFLLAPWSYCMLQQSEDLSSCSESVQQFYQTFYRCDYTAELDNYAATDAGAVVQVNCPNASPNGMYQIVYGGTGYDTVLWYKTTDGRLYGSQDAS